MSLEITSLEIYEFGNYKYGTSEEVPYLYYIIR